MANIWQKHPFRLLLYLEWILLGIALLTAFSGRIPHLRHHGSQPAWFGLLAIICIFLLIYMGLKLPRNSKFIQQAYIFSGFILSWVTALSIGNGERILAVLLLVVVIRGCLLFSWGGRILIAVFAYASFLTVQIMSLMRISPLGYDLG